MRERRRRRRVLYAVPSGIRSDVGKPIPCVLWDDSETGARLAAAHATKLPEVFTLVSDKQSSRLCRIVWRKSPLVGVQFIKANETSQQPAIGETRNRHKVQPTGPVLGSIGLALTSIHGSTKGNEFPVSFIAAGFLFTLIVLTILFYFAGHESQSGVAWAVEVCQRGGNLCQHPELPGAASVLMGVVYLTTKGMEL